MFGNVAIVTIVSFGPPNGNGGRKTTAVSYYFADPWASECPFKLLCAGGEEVSAKRKRNKPVGWLFRWRVL